MRFSNFILENPRLGPRLDKVKDTILGMYVTSITQIYELFFNGDSRKIQPQVQISLVSRFVRAIRVTYRSDSGVYVIHTLVHELILRNSFRHFGILC